MKKSVKRGGGGGKTERRARGAAASASRAGAKKGAGDGDGALEHVDAVAPSERIRSGGKNAPTHSRAADRNVRPTAADRNVRPTENALTGRARKAVEEALSLAKTVYGIDVEGMAGPEVHRLIAAKVGEVRGREMKISEVSMMGSVLSVAWAEAICRELGWEWVMVKGVAAVASANRSHVVYPVTYFCNGMARGGVEPLGLYERIKSGSLGEAGAGEMVEVG